MSLGYLDQDGMMKRFDESYDPNYNYQRFNYRSNIDVDITNTTQLKRMVRGIPGNRRDHLLFRRQPAGRRMRRQHRRRCGAAISNNDIIPDGMIRPGFCFLLLFSVGI